MSDTYREIKRCGRDVDNSNAAKQQTQLEFTHLLLLKVYHWHISVHEQLRKARLDLITFDKKYFK